MKAYKIIDTRNEFNDKNKGRLYTYSEQMGYYVLAATPTSPTIYGNWSEYDMKRTIEGGYIIEVNLENERWVHPHLLKSIKLELLK
jgi:hypothetical protein